ncbi:hypothetical protein O3G_MSEX009776 [Manduca sexta]|uniref:LysM domain-containing protein n=1 Tax=Manduca sexta TaxID=7130 RepID=A0A921ZEK0_MANSE|nr:hypothetical protein O3G_MSEX009776 [Manduca sexta]
MKQRTRLMHSGDDLVAHTMGTNKKDDDDGQSEIQLYRIKPQEHFIEAQVQEGDTLQAIALRFYCSISELKRINHIHKDNEIFARRTIKVPVTPYSVLTELIPVAQNEPVPSTSSEIPNSIQELIHNGVPQTNVSQTQDDHCAIDCNAVVMNSTVTPAVIPYTDAEPIEQFTEDTQLLPKEKIPVEAVVVKEFTSHGADFGLKWFHLLGLVVILGIIVPILYIMLKIDKAPHPDDLPPHPDDLPPLFKPD